MYQVSYGNKAIESHYKRFLLALIGPPNPFLVVGLFLLGASPSKALTCWRLASIETTYVTNL
jgi:hypothetical protein